MYEPSPEDYGALLSREANALCGIFQFARERQYPEPVLAQLRSILDDRLRKLAAETRGTQPAGERTSNAA